MPDAIATRGMDWAIFLDFDGTLVDIAPRPHEVVVEPELPGLLEALRARTDGALAIVTGRPLADVDAFLPGMDLDGCGHHGLERRLGGRVRRPDDLPDLGEEVARLRRRLAAHPLIVIEDKGIGVAVHWRTAPEAEADASAAVSELAARLGPGYRIQDGKAVREIVPARSGKGNGIRALVRDAPYAGRRPFFAGDDRTDEDGFVAVRELGGLTVKVGPGRTAAERRVGSPTAFRSWLGTWLDDPAAPAGLDLA